jgi:nitrite reductase/ring-hydroxylating ferredoxin subunit
MSDRKKLHDDCEQHDCFLPTDRRSFLRDSFLAVAGALLAVGASSSAAFAMPLEFIEATRKTGTLRTYPIPSTDGAQIDKANDVILVRWQGAVYAFGLSCPHQNTTLRWEEKAHTFKCPKHHSEFTVTGDYIPGSGRATRDMDRLSIRRDGASVSVDIDALYEETDGAKWAEAVVKLS